MNVSTATKGQLRYALYEKEPLCDDEIAYRRYSFMNTQYLRDRRAAEIARMRAEIDKDPRLDPRRWGPKKV